MRGLSKLPEIFRRCVIHRGLRISTWFLSNSVSIMPFHLPFADCGDSDLAAIVRRRSGWSLIDAALGRGLKSPPVRRRMQEGHDA